jgi:adenylate kinase family enzyme
MSILKHKIKTKLGENELLLAQNKEEKYVYVPKKGDEREIVTELGLTPYPFLDLKHRQRSGIFISGISGSGKSTIAKQLIDGYLKLLGKQTRIILFTQTEDLDPVFEPFDESKSFVHVCIKSDPMYTSILTENLKDSIVIFDDYENLDKSLQVFTMTLIKDILERGRKMNIQTILINHQTQNYNKTRALIFECDTYVLFPNSNKNSVKKFLLSYGDVDKKEVGDLIEDAMNPFDFLLFRKSVPRYILTKNKIKLI